VRILNRISDGTKATAVVVILLMALVGFFAGQQIKEHLVPGPERVRTIHQVIPGPTVTITGAPGQTKTLPGSISTVTASPQAHPTGPPPAPTVTLTRTLTSPDGTVTVTRRSTATVTAAPLPRVTLTQAPVVVVHCYAVNLLGVLVRISCP
jgi:hypothetical protein